MEGTSGEMLQAKTLTVDPQQGFEFYLQSGEWGRRQVAKKEHTAN